MLTGSPAHTKQRQKRENLQHIYTARNRHRYHHHKKKIEKEEEIAMNAMIISQSARRLSLIILIVTINRCYLRFFCASNQIIINLARKLHFLG